MQLSVVILNYNVCWFLRQCIDSVKNATAGLDAEIIVVDNNSPDDSCDMVKQHFPEITLIENKENSGFPKGNNIGVAHAKGEYICILNPDTVVAEDTFKKVLAFVQLQENHGITGVKLIDGTGNFLPESKRGVPTPFVAFTKILGLYKVLPQTFGKYYASHLNQNQTGEVDILVGAFMVMKREDYLSVGGFDENCFMYSDDIDLSYMMLKTGKRNFYFHETSVIHYKGESTVKDKSYMRNFRQAMDFFYKKHFRSSYFFDLSMKVGAYVFSAAKRSKAEVPEKKPDQYILISDDIGRKTQVENLLRKEVNLQSELHASPKPGTEIIFDKDYLNYSNIISLMEQYKKVGVTFKILHGSGGFLIGSNSSYGRGDVIHFADRR